jgi:hypothetical protein
MPGEKCSQWRNSPRREMLPGGKCSQEGNAPRREMLPGEKHQRIVPTIKFSKFSWRAISAVSPSQEIETIDYKDDLLHITDQIRIFTLRECIQTVFEDRPYLKTDHVVTDGSGRQTLLFRHSPTTTSSRATISSTLPIALGCAAREDFSTRLSLREAHPHISIRLHRRLRRGLRVHLLPLRRLRIRRLLHRTHPLAHHSRLPPAVLLPTRPKIPPSNSSLTSS